MATNGLCHYHWNTIKFIPLALCLFFSFSNLYAEEATSSTQTNQSMSNNTASSLAKLPINNAGAVLGAEQIKDILKNSYISPCNYPQDPIAFNMGLTTVAPPCGRYHFGLSSINSINIFVQDKSRADFVDSIEAWGQTARLSGFAVGGALTAAFTDVQRGPNGQFVPKWILSPNQAYIDFQYKNKFSITVGNLLLDTPWVNSINSYPGGTYANLNNNYQGITADFQTTPTTYFSVFRALTYLQYPNSVFKNTNLYNTYGGPLENLRKGTPGTSGVGFWWDPCEEEDLNIWFYRFLKFADMWYGENTYNFKLPAKTSLDLGIQALTQYPDGDSLTSSTLVPGSTTQYLGSVHGNAVGIKFGLNLPQNNTITIGYNNIFGRANSFLNGGIVTPYTFGLETDPLYTTPALSSLAEFGSGKAYIIKDSQRLCDDNLKLNFSFSQFFVKKVYSSQPNKVTEYDAALVYTIPHTTLSIWSRIVYLKVPRYVGKNLVQPRLIINYTF